MPNPNPPNLTGWDRARLLRMSWTRQRLPKLMALRRASKLGKCIVDWGENCVAITAVVL
jgi:hypothetical protein